MLIDAHAHIDLYEHPLLDSVLEEIEEHRILTLSNSLHLSSYERNRQIAERCPLILPTFGVHPWHAAQYLGRLQDLGEAAEKSPLLGEIGLDYELVKDTSQFPAQREVFEFLLATAREQDKIVNLHTKGAEQEVLDLLQTYDISRAIIHWYSGPVDILRKFVDRGAYFTVGVELLHSEHIKAIARELPAELLLTETDNPGGLEWLTGEPGMPAMVEDVITALAELRGVSVEEMVKEVQRNFERLMEKDAMLAEWYSKAVGQTPPGG